MQDDLPFLINTEFNVKDYMHTNFSKKRYQLMGRIIREIFVLQNLQALQHYLAGYIRSARNSHHFL